MEWNDALKELIKYEEMYSAKLKQNRNVEATNLRKLDSWLSLQQPPHPGLTPKKVPIHTKHGTFPATRWVSYDRKPLKTVTEARSRALQANTEKHNALNTLALMNKNPKKYTEEQRKQAQLQAKYWGEVERKAYMHITRNMFKMMILNGYKP